LNEGGQGDQEGKTGNQVIRKGGEGDQEGRRVIRKGGG
jgi:hypothetical protein